MTPGSLNDLSSQTVNVLANKSSAPSPAFTGGGGMARGVSPFPNKPASNVNLVAPPPWQVDAGGGGGNSPDQWTRSTMPPLPPTGGGLLPPRGLMPGIKPPAWQQQQLPPQQQQNLNRSVSYNTPSDHQRPPSDYASSKCLVIIYVCM